MRSLNLIAQDEAHFIPDSGFYLFFGGLVLDETLLTQPLCHIFLRPFGPLAPAFKCFDKGARLSNDCVADLLKFAVAPAVIARRVAFGNKSDSRIFFLVSHRSILSIASRRALMASLCL